jgi:pimeloyl-ACP methyl ester carboxylesterase
MRFDRIDQFRELHGRPSTPTAFLRAEDDPTFLSRPLARWLSKFPNVIEFQALPGAKLFLQEESPDAVAGWLTEFLVSRN